MRSSSNRPPSATTLSVIGCRATRAAVTIKLAIDRAAVQPRRPSDNSRSSMRIEHAVAPKKISGVAQWSPALNSATLKPFIPEPSRGDLRDQELFRQMLHRCAHDIEQRRGPYADQEHRRRQ